MSIRLLTRDDAPPARALYKAARDAGALDFWPGGTADLQPADLLREIIAGDALAPGYFSDAGVLRGFFLVRKEGIPSLDFSPPMPESYVWRPDSWRMWLWITEMGLSAQQYKAALDALFDTGWFGNSRGRFCWGMLPRDLCPARAKTYLDNRFEWYDYTDREGIVWRYWVPGVV